MCRIGKWFNLLMPFAVLTRSKIIPENYVINKLNPEMGCDVMSTRATDQVTNLTCNNPSASVLFDGVIPSVSDNSEWERQLLRLRSDSTITFNFGSMTSVNISVIEIVYHNCPSRSTGTSGFSIRNIGQSFIAAVGNANRLHSCDHLIRICFSPTFDLLTSFLLQSVHPLADVYLAEITFRDNARKCNEPVSIVRSTNSNSGYNTVSTAPQTSTASVKSHTQTSSPQNVATSSSPSFNLTIVIIMMVAFAILTIIIMVGFLIFLLRRKKKLKLESMTNQTCHNATEMLAKTSHNLSYSNTNNDLDASDGDGYYAKVEKKHKTLNSVSVIENSKNAILCREKNEESPDIGQLYSVVDKSAAKKDRHEADLHESSDFSEMHSVVNKKSNKVRKESVPIEPQEKNDLYAVVDKSEKKKRKTKEQNIMQMYAVVNKTKNLKS